MPRNPNKARCTHPGCRAWAVRGSSPDGRNPSPDGRNPSPDGRNPSLDGPAQPLCAAHGGQSTCPEPRRGAPLGNQNARTHGFYASTLDPQEHADLDDAGDLAGATTLDAEIIIARVALRRLLHMFHTGTTPGPNPQPLTAQDYVNLIGLAFRGCGTLSRLLRARKAIGGDQPDRLHILFGHILDDLSEELGRPL